MHAQIRPLKGKYYGTLIDIIHPNGTYTLDIWFQGDGTPSERELADIPKGEQIWDYLDGSHMETKDGYELAQLICDAINSKKTATVPVDPQI